MEQYTFKVQNLIFFGKYGSIFLVFVTYEACIQDHNYFFYALKKACVKFFPLVIICDACSTWETYSR